MSWADNLLDCSYRGQAIQVRAEQTGAQYALVQHGVPYRNGDDVEALGRQARSISITAVEWGSSYDIALQRLLAIFEQQSGELIHPVYGTMHVVLQSWTAQHAAESPDACQLQLNFLESTPAADFFERTLIEDLSDLGVASDADLSAESWQRSTLNMLARVDTLVSNVQRYVDGGWIGLIEEVTGLPGMSMRLQQLRSQILGVVADAGEMAARPTQQFDPLIDVAKTPGDIRGAFEVTTPANAKDLIAGQGIPQSMPGRDELPNSVVVPTESLLASAKSIAQPNRDVIPEMIPSDPVLLVDWNLALMVVTELALSHATAVAVIIDNEDGDQTLTPDALTDLYNLSRSLIESAIMLERFLFDVERAQQIIEPLRAIAGLIQVGMRQVILRRPPMINRTVDTTTNLRLLAFEWYGDNARADELLRLNPGIRQPSLIQTGEVLRAYAS